MKYVILLMSIVLFVSCNSDEDEVTDANVESYIFNGGVLLKNTTGG